MSNYTKENLIKVSKDNLKPGMLAFSDGINFFVCASGYDEQVASVTLGQVVADGKFQSLSFNGKEVSNSGDPETVENYYTYNGVLPVPDSGGGSGGSADYYKCASVDAVNKTWTGYKAVLNNGVYSFEEILTEGLSYGAGFTPATGTIYDNACLTKAVLWHGTLFKLDSNTLAYLNFDNGNVADVASHTVTKKGGNFTPDGYYSGAWDFNSGYLQIAPTSNEFVFGTGDFTWEAYIYPTSEARQCLFAYEQDGIFSVCFSYGGVPNLAIFWRGEWYDNPISSELSMNVWQHVAFVRKNGIFSCFVNGIKQSQTYDLSSVSVGETGQKFCIGRWGDDPSDFGARWVGRMDEIRISNIARYTDNFIPA